ncbi:hypothetical protein RJ55_08242 [Drechmeria coniospora]|nr:hypothetical protein RJ55_08242 [Drechmeria coniospora]
MADAAWMAAWAEGEPPGGRSLLSLPLEVLARVAASLPTADFGSLRLSCRSVERKLHAVFAHDFFTKKQFMVTENSLQALHDISESRLAVHLRHLHIGLERFPEGIHRPLPDEGKERRFKKRYADHFILWNTGGYREMLTDIFRNLPNLEHVVLRDFNSQKRLRDGADAQWTSYGSKTIFGETGLLLGQAVDSSWGASLSLQFCSQVFALILHALGVAGAEPKGIEVMARHGNRLRGFAFHIPSFIEPSVTPILNKLEKLHLSIDLTWRAHGPVWGPPGTSASVSEHFLRNFLSQCTSLTSLRINEGYDQNPALEHLFDWLASTADDVVPAPPALPNLQELSFGFMNVHAAPLLHVIRRFASSLRRLELWKVTLLRSLPPGDDAGDPPRLSFWLDFLSQLRAMPDLDLNLIMVGMAKQAYSHRPAEYKVSFADLAKMRYAGPRWKDHLDDVMPTIQVKWPRHVTPDPIGITAAFDGNGHDDDDDDDDGSEHDVDTLNEPV